ncbi:MAG: hypothetical protein JOY84_18140 [Curvibacter sp.]|nr:hypothetical protein [Curvibacter sp.]
MSMNILNLTYSREDQFSGELSLELIFDGGSGRGTCYLNSDHFYKMACRFGEFPLPSDELLCIEGGFYDEKGRQLIQKHLHVSVRPMPYKSWVLLKLIISRPSEIISGELEMSLIYQAPFEYQKLQEFANILACLARGEIDGAQLEFPVIY